MENVSTMTATGDNDGQVALAWLRNALTATLEVCPLSYRQKKETARFIAKMPNWLMAKWADAFNIDYMGGRSRYPNISQQAKGDVGRQMAQQYLEAHDAVPVGNCLDQLVKTVVKQANENKLPLDGVTIERQVCALAWSECTADGIEFVEKAHKILSDPANPNHIIVDYQIVLERGDKEKLERLNAILTGGRYGEWVDTRLDEMKRYFGVDTPVYRINFVERTPQWDAFWENIIKGGTN